MPITRLPWILPGFAAAAQALQAVKVAACRDNLPGVDNWVLDRAAAVLRDTRRKAGFTPLLAARDRHGRVRGWACGLLSNFAEYPGSDWLLFGISSLDVSRSHAARAVGSPRFPPG